MIVYFQRNYRSFKIWGSIPMAYSLKAIADDLLSVERSYTFNMIVKFTFYQMFLVFKDWFQCFFYFQSTSYVSIIQILFPIHVFDSNVRCIFPILYTFFPSWIYVSKLQCFQCMFPINIEPYFRLVMVWVRYSNVYRCGKSLCES